MKRTHTKQILLAGILPLLLAGAAHAQLGTGWVAYSPTKKISIDGSDGLHTLTWASYVSVDSPISADYRYDSATDTETFRILDNRSNRSEVRLVNEYSTGRRQFQGYVTFSSPLDEIGRA